MLLTELTGFSMPIIIMELTMNLMTFIFDGILNLVAGILGVDPIR